VIPFNLKNANSKIYPFLLKLNQDLLNLRLKIERIKIKKLAHNQTLKF